MNVGDGDVGWVGQGLMGVWWEGWVGRDGVRGDERIGDWVEVEGEEWGWGE